MGPPIQNRSKEDGGERRRNQDVQAGYSEAPRKRRKGYHRLAHLFGAYPETAMFRKFGSLAMLNLMSLQAELIDIDAKLQIVREDDDASSDANIRMYSSDFSKLRAARPPQDEQRLLLQESQRKLEEYYGLLLQMKELAQMRRPQSHELKFVQDWQTDGQEGRNFLSGREFNTWLDSTASDPRQDRTINDLVMLSAEEDSTELKRWLSPSLLQLYQNSWLSHMQRRAQPDEESGNVINTADSMLVQGCKVLGKVLATTLASLLPVLAVLALYYEKSTLNRIGITIGFTTFFGFVLSAFTSASVKEIFGATAAFVAVEVVFIGSANGSP